MRTKGSLEWDILLGQVAGYRRQGKPQMCWLDSVKEATGLHFKRNSTGKEEMAHAGKRKDSE